MPPTKRKATNALDPSERKRAQNRIPQQCLREKNITYIRNLEETIELLQRVATGSDPQDRYSVLLDAHLKLIAENRKLEDALLRLRKRLLSFGQAATAAADDEVFDSIFRRRDAENPEAQQSAPRTESVNHETPSALNPSTDNQSFQDIPEQANQTDIFKDASFLLDLSMAGQEHEALTPSTMQPGDTFLDLAMSSLSPRLLLFVPNQLSITSMSIFGSRLLGACRRHLDNLNDFGNRADMVDKIIKTAVRFSMRCAGLESYAYGVNGAKYIERVISWRLGISSKNSVLLPFRPTPLQSKNPTHFWGIDLFNWPEIRDQLVLEAESTDFDELLRDLVLYSVIEPANHSVAVNVLDIFENQVLRRRQHQKAPPRSYFTDPSWTLFQIGPEKELGFEGYVMSDFLATPPGLGPVKAGLDMNQPGPINPLSPDETYWGENLVDCVKNKTLSESDLDGMVRRILTPYFYLGQDKDYLSVDPSSQPLVYNGFGYPYPGPSPVGRDVRGNHSALIREIAAAGTVLLKNQGSILPLSKSLTNIGLFGNDAADPSVGTLFSDHYGIDIGTLISGGGSGSGRPSYVISPLDAFKSYAKDNGKRLQYVTNNTAILSIMPGLYPWPEVCIVFLKSFATEGFDRKTLVADDNSIQVVNSIASRCPRRTIVVTHSGGPDVMPWATNPNVSAIIAAHYPGQESGNSILDVLTGKVNPSGKLPYTIAKKEEDYNGKITNITGSAAEDSSNWQSDFSEGLFIDYRHFDNEGLEPLYEFGYGLSYTTFEFILQPRRLFGEQDLCPCIPPPTLHSP
ncbi:beta-glucosidase G [Fusarium circinatum]|uniref:beta-glucosidase n=1 Tax=Fusarium circinatum TaxID=48490 RepID=A0A8H5XBV7_FUSCI|nr:beta-glucosidase G [Fusarium circinatum]